MTDRREILIPAARAKLIGNSADLSIATAGGLALALVAMFLVVAPLAGDVTSTRDYVVFWATGQQLANHGNPYDTASIENIERGAGLPARYGAMYMRNPPWALPLVLPLGFVGVRTGALLWSLLLLGCLLVSSWLLWQMHGRPADRTHWLMYSFAPSLFCLTMGQTTLFSLLGVVLFQYLHRTRPFAAGLALWLCALKPHLFLPFAAVLAAWIVFMRSYRVLAGAAIALATSSAATWLMAPGAWSRYIALLNTPYVKHEQIPCLSVMLRLWADPEAMWVQYLPATLACLWALGYYWRRRAAWSWKRDGSLLALVSLVAAPYSWLYDQTLAAPALLDGAYTTRFRWLLIALAAASVAIMGVMIGGIQVASQLFSWSALLWPAWYAAARGSAKQPGDESESHAQ